MAKRSPYHDLAHFHSFTRPSPIPSDVALPGGGRFGPPLAASDVLFALVASCSLPERLRVADETWCGPHHAGTQCWAYVDCETESAPATGAVRVVPASEYLEPWHAPHEQCCSSTPSGREAGWDGLGPSTFYCANRSAHAAHVARTLPHQYRFLPALRHAKQRLLRADQQWLVLVDDDSWVAPPRLLDVLGRYNPREPLQLGDFVPAPRLNVTHWRRPFACGGAGTVLSRAAAERTDWEQCMRTYAGTVRRRPRRLPPRAPSLFSFPFPFPVPSGVCTASFRHAAAASTTHIAPFPSPRVRSASSRTG